ncbi:MAG: hypothetical protein ACLRQX_06815 [Turicibacter sanguinis]
MGNITNIELHRLYEAAIAFRDLKPWTWMYASQVFIIHDDERDIDGFCSIMGMMGEHFSLSVYLGQVVINHIDICMKRSLLIWIMSL